MANRRHGISWSLSGKVDVYREKVDPFMSVCGVRKEKIQGIYQSKGMACSVYVKKDDKDVAHFVTWSGLTKHLNKGTQMNHYSKKRFGKHSASIDSESTVETFGHFSFFPAGSIFASLSPKKFRIITFRPLQQQEFTTDLEAYCFFGPEKLKLKLKFERDTQTHKLLTSDTSGTDRKLEWSSVLGAPIIVKNKDISARKSSRWSVVGVVGLNPRERELCPYFVENKIFEQDASGLPFNDELHEVGASAHTSQYQHNASHPTDELHEVGASAHMSQSQHNASHPTDELGEVGASAHMSQSQHNASHPTDELHEVGASAHMSQSQHNASHPTDELHEVGASAHMSQSQHNASHPTDELHEVGASAHMSQSQHNASHPTDELHEVGASAHMSQSQHNASHPTDELDEVGASAHMSQSQHNASHPTDELDEVGASAHMSQSQHNASHPTDELHEVGASAHMSQSQHNASLPTDELDEVGASAHMSQSQHNASHPTDELHEVDASAHMSQSQHNASHPTDELHEVGASAHMSQSQHNASHPTDELHELGASAHVSQSQHNASRLTDKLHEVGASAKQRKTGSPSQQELIKLCGKIAAKWKVLARVLDVDDDSIDVIEHDYNTVVERCYQSLLIWKRGQGVEDNNYYKVLETGLCDPLVGRRDLAEEFCYY
ncbi:uncharacterized protein [Montipora foliosa]|uniref:uncharacterized protein isoform X2 n=1 Tax=Montipora foliosa TaxID=591990 RepID=UPI0035F131B1